MSSEFDRYAGSYSALLSDPIRDRFAGDSQFFHLRKWDLISSFLRRHRIDPSMHTWIDVGCGRGELLALGRGSFAKTAGCDPSSKMIGACNPDVFQQESPGELPFPDRSADFVTAVCVYHHVHGRDRMLLTKSIHRVLKLGGLFCMIEHNPWNPLTQLIVHRCPVDADAELLSAQSARRLLCSAEFEILKTEYFLYLPETVFKKIGRVERTLTHVPLGGQFAIFCRRAQLSEPR